MRSTDEREDAPVIEANEECPWCHGTHYVSVPNDHLILKENLAEGIIEKGIVAFMPTMGVACPECHKNGLRLSAHKTVLSLTQHADRIQSTRESGFFALLCTVVYLNLRMQKPRPEDERWCLDMLQKGIPGAGTRHILEGFLTEIEEGRKRLRAGRKVVAQPKYIGRKLTQEEQDAKRERARKELSRMMGEHDED
jgi:ssDNA-binding Zn-finger/Zn-ribbon topoisomerase 1